jgi:hypothetical protein
VHDCEIIECYCEIIQHDSDIRCYILCEDVKISDTISHTWSLLGEQPITTITFTLTSHCPLSDFFNNEQLLNSNQDLRIQNNYFSP